MQTRIASRFFAVGVVIALVSSGGVAVAAPDVDAPVWPPGATIAMTSVTSTTATLSWPAAVDDVGVSGYRVLLDGASITTTAVPSVDLTGLTPSTAYSVTIEAFDLAGNESSPGGFVLQPRVDLYAGVNAHSVKGFDVDGDGAPDLVSAVAGDDGVSILLGNGDGTFGTPTVYTSGTSTGSIYPKNAVVVDVDGDGAVDLVTANQNSDTIGVLLGNGDGTFSSASAYGTCNGTHDVTAGDYNADGFVDVAAVCWGDTVTTMWFGNGDGTFSGRSDISTSEPTSCISGGRCAHGIGTADLNGDGDDDLAIAAYGGVSATVMLGNGDKTFATPVTYGVAGNPHDIAIGDFNADGHPDLVTANESSNNVTVLLGSASGSLTEVASYAATYEPKGITTGDLDGDGNVDIAIASAGPNYPFQTAPGGDLITIWLGNGDGTFSSGGGFGDFASQESTFDVAIVDLNGDGVNDVAASGWHSGNVSIFFGADSGGPTSTFTTDPPPDVMPSVLVSGPVNWSSQSAPVSITGTASDDTGVDAVRLEVYDRDSTLWWNGSGWQAGRTSFTAVLGTPGATSTGWSYLFDPGVPATAPYWVTVRSFDAAGNVSGYVYVNFTIG